MADLDREIETASKKLESAAKHLRELRARRAEAVKPALKTRIVKKARCRHFPMSHFKVSEHEWRCSHCKREGVWTDSWNYFGSIGCRKCGDEPAIELVSCSDACSVALTCEFEL